MKGLATPGDASEGNPGAVGHAESGERTMTTRAASFLRSTSAVSALEYALLVGVIATVVVAALAVFGGQLTAAITAISPEITEAASEVVD